MKHLVFGLCVLSLIGCDAGRDKTNVELIQDMMEMPNIKSQEFDEKTGKSHMRMPPQGTVSRDVEPYRFKGDILAAEANLKNPLAGNMSNEILLVGKAKYEIYCGICHGNTGKGDGSIAQYLNRKPPVLVDDRVRAFKDGRYYHVIVEGQGLMMGYGSQIHSEQDRWAIVNYIRKLQK
jgi:mono/diheme cytochrome c family protein